MDKIIEELSKLEELLRNSKADLPDNTASIQGISNDVHYIISQLMFDNMDVLGRLAYFFEPESDLTKIAKANGWDNELADISNKIHSLVGIIRIVQKENPENFDNIREGKYVDSNTYASNPGKLLISDEKWKDIIKAYELGFFAKLFLNSKRNMVQERLSYGDTQPAMVMSLSPFLVSAYSDEMDAVILLRFPEKLAQINNFKLYDRLITVNCYGKYSHIEPDIFVGPHYIGRWTNFAPLIGELLSSETNKIQQHKRNIPEGLWQYVRTLSDQYLLKHKSLARNGFWFLNK